MKDSEEDINKLILDGVVEFASINEQGNFLYKFTAEAHKLSPKIYNRAMDVFHKNLMILWEKGFVSMDIMDPEPMVSLTEKAFDDVAINGLTNMEQVTLKTTIQALKK